ncbi:DUF2511 domain-containing protein [Catellatospora methionotrophica]
MLTGCAEARDTSVEVSRSSFSGEGKVWPLTVESGKLACDDGVSVTFESSGSIYAVNGTARDTGIGREIRPIWRDDPQYPGLKISIKDLINTGLELC